MTRVRAWWLSAFMSFACLPFLGWVHPQRYLDALLANKGGES